MGFVLGKHGRHALVLVEFGLESGPVLVDLFYAQLASHQMHEMEGQNGQEQMGFNLLILAVMDGAEAQVGFHGSEGVFNLSQLPVRACKILTGPLRMTGAQDVSAKGFGAGIKGPPTRQKNLPGVRWST